MDHPNPNSYWKHRRRLAYMAFLVLTVMAATALFGEIRDEQTELVAGLAWVFGFVVIAYYGNNAAEAFAKRGKP